jgi:ribonuclease T2
MKHSFLASALVLSLFSTAGAARAEVKMSGSFVAKSACPATSSIRGAKNPGGVQLEPGKAYNVVAKNKDDATHYLIEAPGADPERRWVAIGCGDLAGYTKSTGAAASQVFVLAMSWEPEFCTAHKEKKECATETPQSFDATRLALHGLWPQPRGTEFCNVDPAVRHIAETTKDFSQLPAVTLSPPVKTDLDVEMPGTQSFLERHEWFRHGSCAVGATQDSYFATAAALASELNKSKVRDLFANNVGKPITFSQIKAAMEESFGQGAGDRVQLHCKGQHGDRTITEFFVTVAGKVGDQASLAQWIAAATPQPAQCGGGIVKAVAN